MCLKISELASLGTSVSRQNKDLATLSFLPSTNHSHSQGTTVLYILDPPQTSVYSEYSVDSFLLQCVTSILPPTINNTKVAHDLNPSLAEIPILQHPLLSRMADSLFITPSPPPPSEARIKIEDGGSVNLNYDMHHDSGENLNDGMENDSGEDLNYNMQDHSGENPNYDTENDSGEENLNYNMHNNAGEDQVGVADEEDAESYQGNSATTPNDMSGNTPMATDYPPHRADSITAHTDPSRASTTQSTPNRHTRGADSGSSPRVSAGLSPAMLDIIHDFLAQAERQAKRDVKTVFAAGKAKNAREVAAGRAANARELADGKAANARELAEGKAAIARQFAEEEAAKERAIDIHYVKYSDAKSSLIDRQVEIYRDRQQKKYDRDCEELQKKHNEKDRALQEEFEARGRALEDSYAGKQREYDNGVRKLQRELNDMMEDYDQKKLELDTDLEKEKARLKARLDKDIEQEKKKRYAELDIEMEQEEKRRRAKINHEMEQEEEKLKHALEIKMDQLEKKRLAEIDSKVDEAKKSKLKESEASITAPTDTVDAGSNTASVAATTTITDVANVSSSTDFTAPTAPTVLTTPAIPTASTVPTAPTAAAIAQYTGQQTLGTGMRNQSGRGVKRGINQISNSKESIRDAENMESAAKRIRLDETGASIPVTGQSEGSQQSASPSYDDLSSESDPDHDQTAAPSEGSQQSASPLYDDLSSESDSDHDQTAAPAKGISSQPSHDGGSKNKETTTDNSKKEDTTTDDKPIRDYFLRSKLNPSEESLKAAATASPTKGPGSRDRPKRGFGAMLGSFNP